MNESLESLFRSDYMPHGHCYLWKPEILWLNVTSDLFIALAYFSIPIAIYYFVKKRSDLQFKGIFILFSLFILFCGITHIISIITIWTGIYGISGLAKLATAIVSCITAYKVFQSIPVALKLPTQNDLKQAHEKASEERFQRLKLEGKAKEETMLRESTNIAHVGVFAFNHHGNVIVANDAACSIFEARKAELEAKNIEELIVIAVNSDDEATKRISLKELWQLQANEMNPEVLVNLVYALTLKGNKVPLSIRLKSQTGADSFGIRESGVDSPQQIITFASFQDMTQQLQNQKALAENEKLTRSIIESLPIGLHIFEKRNDKLYLTGYNKAAERLLGFEHKKILNYEISEAFPDLKHTDIPDVYKKIATEGGHWSNQSISYDDAKVSGVFDVECFQSVTDTVVVLFEDVTEQQLAKRAIAEKELFIKTAFNVSITGVSVYNYETRSIEFINESFTDITGYSAAYALRLDQIALSKLIHPEDRSRVLEHWLTLRLTDADAVTQIDYRLKHANGKWIWCLAKDVVFEKDDVGNVVRTMSSFLNITEIKSMQNNLIKLKDAAEQASAAKSTFLANMSHEIRTPMNAILGLTNIVLRMDLGTKQRDYLSRLEASSQSLLSLLNDILDYSKIEAGKLKINKEIFELDFIIDNCTGLFGFLAEQKNINFIVKKEEGLAKFYLGDPIRLSQIINNLLGNAVKFTNKGYIELLIKTAGEKNNEYLVFTVRDTGIGMSAEQAEFLFDAFSQADSSISRQFGGTGLGLAISRSLTNLMNGALTFKTEVNKGSEFTLALPFSSADFGDVHGAEVLTGSALLGASKSSGFDITEFDNVNALVVEDNVTNQIVAAEFLARLNIQSFCVDNGLEAIKAIESDNFDIILMDLQMPIMDGFSATRVIRETQIGRDTPIIAMSAAVSESDIERVLAAGMNQHLPKPFNLPLLFHRLCEFLSDKKTSRPIQKMDTKWAAEDYPDNFDLNNAIIKVGGDESLYLKLIHNFADDFTGKSRTIQKAFESADYTIVERYAHTIKGLAEGMGAINLFEVAKKLEQDYQAQIYPDPINMTQELDEVIVNINLVSSQKAGDIKPLRGGTVKSAIAYTESLQDKLSGSQFIDIEDIKVELSAIAEFVDTAVLDEFCIAINKLEYKQALVILGEMTATLHAL